MQVVDPHIHLWDLNALHYPWLAKPGVSFVGDARALKHDYLLNDLLHDAQAVELLKVVHVEANHDPADPVAETRWLQGIANETGARGMPNGILRQSIWRRPMPRKCSKRTRHSRTRAACGRF